VTEHRVEAHHVRAVASLGRRTALIATPEGIRLSSAYTTGTLLTRAQLAEEARREGATIAVFVNTNADRIAARLNAELEAKEH
jgi:hypothetical protein